MMMLILCTVLVITHLEGLCSTNNDSGVSPAQLGLLVVANKLASDIIFGLAGWLVGWLASERAGGRARN